MDLASVVAALEALDLAHAPPGAMVSLLAACAATEARIAVRLATAAAEPAAPVDAGPDRFLTVKEAAARLGMTPQYIYDNQATLPFVAHVGRAVRISEHKLGRYMANRTRTRL
jgi:excisionase family DNA binding protein